MNPLHSAESINSFFIEQIKDYAIFATDPQGIITAWNTGAKRLKGYSEEEAVGSFYGMLHPYEYQQAGVPEQELKIALQEGVYEIDDWRKRKDDSLFWATVTLTPIFSGDGKHIGYTKITGDISKQKELQDKLAERQQHVLERKNNELQRINLDLDNFVYTASHDLRSPINNIEALVNILKVELTDSSCLSENASEILQRVNSSISRFKHTIESLTDISRMQKGLSEYASEEIISIKKVYEDIVEDLNFPKDQNNCFIHTDFKVYELQFSEKNLRSILYNLVSNAIKYQAPERECIIKINTRMEEPYVVLSVEDNGIGINERHQQEMFTMFKRFHDHVEGTGIGLYMVKRIIENAGGKIEVESQEGTGTKVSVYFKSQL